MAPYAHISVANSHRDYEPVDFVPELPHFPVKEFSGHLIGGYRCQLETSSWLSKLEFENDMWLKGYIRTGILDGFDIVDDVLVVQNYDRGKFWISISWRTPYFY